MDFYTSAELTFILNCAWIMLMLSPRFVLMLKHSSNNLWDSQCYVAPVKHERSTLFYYRRALPAPKLLPCCWGLWAMWIPLNQPGIATKQQSLHLEAGSVQGWSSTGEPHAPDKASSLRFSCSLCGSHSTETRWTQVRKYTQIKLSELLWWCLCTIVIYSVVYCIIYAAQHLHLISVKKQYHASFLIEVLVKLKFSLQNE